MKEVGLPSLDTQNRYLKNTFLEFISDIGVKNMALFEVSYFTRNIHETKTVTSRLCYIEHLIFLQINIV